MRIYQNKIILLIIIIVVFIADIYLLNLSEFNNDEALWALYAMNSIQEKASPHVGLLGSMGIYQGLLTVYLYIALFSIFGCSMYIIGAFLIILHLTSIVVLYAVVRKMYNTFVAFLACLFYITSPVFINFYALKGNDYCFYFIPLTLVIYSLHKIVNDKNRHYFILLSVSLCMATQFHSSAYFIIPACLVFLWLNFNNLKNIKGIKIFVILSLIILFIFIGPHLYTILTNLKDIKMHINPHNNLLLTSKKILGQIAAIDNLKHTDFLTFKNSIHLLYDPHVVLIILFLLFSFFNSASSKFKNNDALLSLWISITFFLFLILCYFFNHNPSPIFAVFFPAVFIAEASFVSKAYFKCKKIYLKRFLIGTLILIILINIAVSFSDIQFVRKTGGIGWHRPTRSVRIRVIDYIFYITRVQNKC